MPGRTGMRQRCGPTAAANSIIIVCTTTGYVVELACWIYTEVIRGYKYIWALNNTRTPDIIILVSPDMPVV